MVSPVPSDTQEFARGVIRQAARETGADFDFLLNTAARESNFDARARAGTSSAAGMFQFIEQTWLGMMDRHGERHGYGQLSQAITRSEDGRFSVSDPAKRQQIMDLRFDPTAAARMAGELAAENSGIIESRIRRRPSSGELYAAHFLGAGGAAGLITVAQQSPDVRADQLFPEAARANRRIFFDNGQPRSAAAVLSLLTGEANAASSRPAQFNPGQPTQLAASNAPTPVRYDGPISPGSHRVGHGELSPALVEILASLDAPDSARVRQT